MIDVVVVSIVRNEYNVIRDCFLGLENVDVHYNMGIISPSQKLLWWTFRISQAAINTRNPDIARSLSGFSVFHYILSVDGVAIANVL